MANQYDSKAFKKLQKEWDAILAADGFDDIEDRRHEASNVVMPEVLNMNPPALVKDPYYPLYVDYYKNGEFPREMDRWIFKQHLLGLSNREIETKNRKEKAFKEFSYKTVERSVRDSMARIGMRKLRNA